jgi:hypothetical protein
MSDAPARICRECKFYEYIDKGYWESDKHYCAFDHEKILDLITGEYHKPKLRNCMTERTLTGGCGIEGINFEPK